MRLLREVRLFRTFKEGTLITSEALLASILILAAGVVIFLIMKGILAKS